MYAFPATFDCVANFVSTCCFAHASTHLEAKSAKSAQRGLFKSQAAPYIFCALYSMHSIIIQ